MSYFPSKGSIIFFRLLFLNNFYLNISWHLHVWYCLTFLPRFINNYYSIASEELRYNFHNRIPPRGKVYVLHSDDSLSASSIQFPKNSDPDFTQFGVIIILQKKTHPFLNRSTFSHLDILPKGIKSNFLLLKLLCLTFYFFWSYETWYKQISPGLGE